QPEAIGSRQVPPELVLLSHHQRKASPKGVGPFPGHETEHPGAATGRVDQSAEHLESCGFAGAVGPEKGDHLTRLDREGHAIGGAHFLVLAVEQPPQSAEQALLLLIDPVNLREVAGLDDWHFSPVLFTSCYWLSAL